MLFCQKAKRWFLSEIYLVVTTPSLRFDFDFSTLVCYLLTCLNILILLLKFIEQGVITSSLYCFGFKCFNATIYMIVVEDYNHC